MSEVEIIPSILTNDPDEFRELLKQAEEAGVNRVHVDIIDGVYANNKTIDPSILNDLDSSLKIDFHLMVNNPENWIEKCLRAGASRIIAQIEMMQNSEGFVDKVLSEHAYVGLAIDNDSKVIDLNEDVLHELDLIMVMSVPAGFGGQEFNVNALEKISELREIKQKNSYKFKIAVDGGINESIISQLVKNGADEFCIGRRLFSGDMKENIEKFKQNA